MERFQKLSVYLLIILSVTISFEIYHVLALPAPSTNSTVEPGSMTKACRAIVYKSGSQAVDLDGLTGINNKVTGTDSAVIQDAFTNVLDAGRTQKEAVCLVGSFTLATTVTLPSLSILDNSQGFVTLTTNTSPNPAFSSTNTNNVQVQGGIFDGVTGTDISGIEPENMIFLQQVTSYKVIGITCQKISGECIWNQGNSYGDISGNTITDGKVAGAVAFPTLSSNKVSVTRNNFFTWDTTITIYNGTRIEIGDNNLGANSIGGGPCVEITTQQTTGTIKDVDVHDNMCDSSHSKGVWIHQGNGNGPITNVNVQRNLFRGITCTACTTDVEITFISTTTTGSITQIHVDQNTFVSSGNNAGSGSPCLYLGNNSVSAALTNSTFNYNTFNGCTGELMRFAGDLSNSTIIGNRGEGSGTIGGNSGGIHLLNFPAAGKCNGNIVSDNLIDFTVGGTGYGIILDSGCNFNIIQNNNVQNNPAGGINNGGTSNRVRYNLGYTTENQGTCSISASTTCVVNHGLAGTPTSVTATPPTTATGVYSVSSVGATQFTITVANSGTYTMYWSAVFWPP